MIDAIETLSDAPRPHDVEKLSGYENRWRIRTGNYRIVYQIHDDVLTVLIVRIGHRREVYK
ncbi:MAG TPA: type II toxin-antitoxin system RelE/ParE family toxin [Mycobacteriales bacterium]|nr:type II toxin-antitoxin system RelE/ParE family toxin [Mycobacteriales bacterium]